MYQPAKRSLVLWSSRVILTAATAITFCGPAYALPGPLPDVAVTAEVSTLGLGAQATFKLLPWVNVRGTVQGFNYSHNFSADDTEYQASLKLLSYGALLDFFPLTRGPRLSAGLLGNGNKIGLQGDCNNGCSASDLTIQGSSALVNGGVRFGSVAPYAGIGWGNAMDGLPFYFGVDLGVLFQGTPEVSLAASGTGTVVNETTGATRINVNLSTDPQVQAAVSTEQQTLSDDLKHYRYYPVLALTIGWRF